jgi:hypothetical protein
MGFFRIDRWPPSREAKLEATLDGLWVEVERLLGERDALRKRLADAMDEGHCIGSGRGDGCEYKGKSGETCPRCSGMVLSPREEENADLRVERDSARALARVLAHCYRTDNRPPPHMVREALDFPVIPAAPAKEKT